MSTKSSFARACAALLFVPVLVHGARSPDPDPWVCPPKNVFYRKYSDWSLQLDSFLGPYDFNVWAWRPLCVIENRDKSEGNTRSIFCLFTNNFFGNHGLSIIARPDDIGRHEKTIWEAYQSTFPGPETVQNLNLEPAYEIVDMPEKGGKGVVATRDIKKLETFLVDNAAILGDVSFWGGVGQAQGASLLERAADQLLNESVVTSLGQGAGGEGVEGIIKANTFRTVLDGVPQKALYPVISRINHACEPNAMLRFSHGGIFAGVAAFRDIKQGEEITISYVPLTDTLQERQTKLQGWNFTCSCALCSASPQKTLASDNRRAGLADGINVMMEALNKGDLRGAIDTLQKAAKSLKDEGLEGISGEIYEGLARIQYAMGNKKNARSLARKSVDYYTDFGEVLEPRDREAEVEALLKKFEE